MAEEKKRDPEPLPGAPGAEVMAKLQASVHNAARDGKHAQGWSYATANGFLDALKPAMEDLGISLLPSGMTLVGERELAKGERSTVSVEWRLVTPVAVHTFTTLGASSDRSGNGHSLAQAITDARKTALQLVGNMYSSDDPERTSAGATQQPRNRARGEGVDGVPPTGSRSPRPQSPEPQPQHRPTPPEEQPWGEEPPPPGDYERPESGFQPPERPGFVSEATHPKKGGDPISAKQLGRLFAIGKTVFGSTYRAKLARTVEMWGYSSDAINDRDEGDPTAWLGWKDYNDICEHIEKGGA